MSSQQKMCNTLAILRFVVGSLGFSLSRVYYETKIDECLCQMFFVVALKIIFY
jgi:hypothetical protein